MSIYSVFPFLFSGNVLMAKKLNFCRKMEDQIKKDLADEVFMLRPQIEDVVELLLSAKNILPPSCSSLQGLSLSSMHM